MVKCAKCTKLVGKKSPGVQCSKCSKWFHGACASLSPDQLTALSITDSVDWKCRGCIGSTGGKPKRISVILPDPDDEESEADGPTIGMQEKLLIEIRQEVREMRQTVREIIRDELQSTLKFYSDKIDEYEEKIQIFQTRIKLTENQCKNISGKCANLELKNDLLEQKLNKIEQMQILNNVEICGIAEKENEDINDIATKIGELLNQKPTEITKVYRKKKPRQPSGGKGARAETDAPIVVILQEGCRESWLTAAKDTTILDRDLGGTSEKKIYVRAALTPTTSHLLWKAKTELKDELLCKYVWCKDGQIMVRQREGDKKIYYVRSANDIETIKNELSKQDASNI